LVEESINFTQRQGPHNSLPEIIEFCVIDDETFQHFKSSIMPSMDKKNNNTFLRCDITNNSFHHGNSILDHLLK
jgi:hypothetical protein